MSFSNLADRETLIREATRHFRPRPGALILSVTIVRPEWLSPRGELSLQVVPTIRRWVQSKLRKLDRAQLALGVVEAALNVIDNDEGRWSPHVHMVVRCPLPKRRSRKLAVEEVRRSFIKVLRSETDKPNGVTKTVQVGLIEEVEGLERWLRYITKAADPSSASRRSRYQYRDPLGRRRWTVRKLSLQGAARREFDEAWGAARLTGLVILAGLRRPKGRLQLCRIRNRAKLKSRTADPEGALKVGRRGVKHRPRSSRAAHT